jgi:hypothetical protein
MPGEKPTFILRSKGTILGKVEYEDIDWPWHNGRFSPSKEFAAYAGVFAEAEQWRTSGNLDPP